MVGASPLPLFAFYLVNAAGESYYLDDTGAVQRRGLPTPLVYSPEGWQDMAIGWERNLEKLGLVRNFSLSLGFVGDAAVILEHIFNRSNIDERIWLLAQKLDLEVTVSDFAATHKFYYKGEIDFSTYRKTRRKVLVNIMEGGRSADLKANEATEYKLALDTDPDAIRVKFDGMKLQNQALFALTNGSPTADPFWNYKNHLVDLEVIRKEVEDIGTAKSVTRTQVSNLNTLIRQTGGWVFKATVSGTLSFSYDFTVLIEYDPAAPAINPAAEVKIVLRRIDESNFSNLQRELLDTGTGNAVPGNYNVAGSNTIDVNAGDELYLFAFCNVEGATGDAQLRFTYSGTAPFFKMDYLFTFPATFVKMLKSPTLFKRLVGKISGSEDYAVSTLLDASEICFTSGDGLRGLADTYIKPTLNKFFAVFRALKMAGLGVEGGNIVLEELEHFLNDDVIIDLGEVRDVEISPATELMANTIKSGYPDQKIEDINGKLAFNTEFKWSTPLKRVTRELDLTAPVNADPIQMEVLRANMDGKTTTDNETDNQLFIALVDLADPQVDADGTYYNLKRGTFAQINGLPDGDSAFNILELTPKRILLAWKRYLRSIFWLFDGGLIKFQTSTKSEDLETLGGPDGDIIEAADLTIGAADLGDPLFEPKKIDFVAPAAPLMVPILAETPAACLRFTRNGGSFKGFLLKAGLASKTNQEQKFVILSHPDNDLKLLENAD